MKRPEIGVYYKLENPPPARWDYVSTYEVVLILSYEEFKRRGGTWGQRDSYVYGYNCTRKALVAWTITSSNIEIFWKDFVCQRHFEREPVACV